MIIVTIIIPIYNMEKYLEECLNSVLNQTLKDIEIICIDDGSTDKTHDILKRYKLLYNNIVIINQKNTGASVARNQGIRRAKGEFVAFMDADDYYAENVTLEKLYNLAKKNNVMICGGSINLVKEGKVIDKLSNLRNKSIFRKNEKIIYKDYQYAYGFTRFIYNLDMLKKKNVYFPKYIINEDPPFLVRAMISANEFYAMADVVYYARTVDKKTPKYDAHVICDIAGGFCDILSISRQYGLEKLHTDIVEEIFKKWINIFYKHISQENVKLHNIISEINLNIDEKLIKQDGRFAEMPRILSTTEIKKLVYEYREKELEFRMKIQKFNKVIVYGAGMVGKETYDYISSISGVNILGFSVTQIETYCTARNIQIRKIEDFIDNKLDALVLISVLEEKQSEIKNKLKEYGFKNIMNVNYLDLQMFLS